MTDQQPPYEDVEPAVDMHKAPVPRPQAPRPGEVVSQHVVPDQPATWSEARIMRLAASFVATLFIVAFVVAASRVIVWYLVWAPFLVGALPFLAFAWAAWRKHLDDESDSRRRWENWQQSRFDASAFPDDKGANKRRWS